MTESRMTVSVSELRDALNRAVETLAATAGETIDLKHDFFWTVDSDRIFDMQKKPDQDDIEVGQVSDSWEFLQRGKDDEEMRTSFDLVWAGEVLLALGHQLNQPSRRDS